MRGLLLLLACAVALLAPSAAVAGSLTSSSLLRDVNALRAAHGLRPLRLSRELTAAAAQHSQEMAADGYFAHESVNGQPFWERIRNWYRPLRGRWSVGENLLWSSPGVTARGAIRMWMASPEHRAILLGAGWREVGFAAVHEPRARGAYHGREVTILTADFGVRG